MVIPDGGIRGRRGRRIDDVIKTENLKRATEEPVRIYEKAADKPSNPETSQEYETVRRQ